MSVVNDREPGPGSVRARCEIQKTIESIRQDGFKSQRGLIEEDSNGAHKSNNEFVCTYLNEVTVDIGPDGEILFRAMGQHRLSIAKLLNVAKVPFLVAVRHPEW